MSRFQNIAALGLLLAAAGLALAAAPGSRGAEEASSTGSPAAACAECHEDVVTALARQPHVALDREGLAPAWAGAESSCIACHGDAAEHLKQEGAGAIFAFSDSDPPTAKSEVCLTCHTNTHPRFLFSAHAKAGLDCTSCHAPHPLTDERPPGLAALAGRASATCVECHTAELSQFTFTDHHRLEEGTLECTSCHNPHDASPRVMLGAFKQATCIGCHTDKGGPFVFEHASNRIEGCTACHTPHGSPNRHLLTFQSVAEQCFSCHALVPGFHSRFTLDTQCTGCHSTIHGSNLHPFFLK